MKRKYVFVFLALISSALWAITAETLSIRILGKNYVVSQGYLNYYSENPTPDHFHAGIDFAAPAGTGVRALLGGTVLYAGGDYGTVSVYDGANTLIYLHMTGITVKKDDKIQYATTIGKVGSKGASKPHLHFEVRRGKSPLAVGPTSGSSTASLTYNPLTYLK